MKDDKLDTHQVATFILSGGQGERLYPLTKRKVKPAVFFGGLFRLIDLSLSNCLHSDMRKIWVLTQYKSQALQRHIQRGWQVVSPALGEFIEAVPPQQSIGKQWYRGTADAIMQNLFLYEDERLPLTLILSGDHVYKMDYRSFLRFHLEKEAALSIAVIRVPRLEASRFGVLSMDSDNRITRFQEKPADPPATPDNPDEATASMGIYFFNTDRMAYYISKDARRADTNYDFGKDIIPAMLDAGEKLYAYDFTKMDPYGQSGWWDVGTIDALFDLHMELLDPGSRFKLRDPAWPIWSHFAMVEVPSEYAGSGGANVITRSLISGGGHFEGCTIDASCLSPGVLVGEGSVLKNAVVYPNVRIGRNCRIERAILDENAVIPDDTVVSAASARADWTVSAGRVVVVPSD